MKTLKRVLVGRQKNKTSKEQKGQIDNGNERVELLYYQCMRWLVKIEEAMTRLQGSAVEAG